MCQICKRTPCMPMCPNERSSSYDDCAECGSSIYQGQEHYNLNGYKFHSNCITLLDSAEILRILNIKPIIRSKDL